MRPTHLRVPHRRLDGRRPLHRHVSQVVGDFFQRPTCFVSTMGKIMAEVVTANVGNEFPFFVVGEPFQRPKPGMDAVFGEMGTALRGGQTPCTTPRGRGKGHHTGGGLQSAPPGGGAGTCVDEPVSPATHSLGQETGERSGVSALCLWLDCLSGRRVVRIGG